MIPIGDNVRSRTFPFVNLTIIFLNVAFFVYALTISTTQLPPFGLSELDSFFFTWGVIPACVGDAIGLEPEVRARALEFYCSTNAEGASLFYSMFLHGGWIHLLGNMIFLWVFGDNVEDALGHIRYAIFYGVVGVGATALHIASDVNEVIPSIGASGAIAGVLGGYLVLFPRATVAAVFPLFILVFIPFYIPAVILIGFWFFMQLLNGLAAFATTDVVNAGGGIAWFAHIGGFLAGVVLIKLFMIGRRTPPLQRRRASGGS